MPLRHSQLRPRLSAPGWLSKHEVEGGRLRRRAAAWRALLPAPAPLQPRAGGSAEEVQSVGRRRRRAGPGLHLYAHVRCCAAVQLCGCGAGGPQARDGPGYRIPPPRQATRHAAALTRPHTTQAPPPPRTCAQPHVHADITTIDHRPQSTRTHDTSRLQLYSIDRGPSRARGRPRPSACQRCRALRGRGPGLGPRRKNLAALLIADCLGIGIDMRIYEIASPVPGPRDARDSRAHHQRRPDPALYSYWYRPSTHTRTRGNSSAPAHRPPPHAVRRRMAAARRPRSVPHCTRLGAWYWYRRACPVALQFKN